MRDMCARYKGRLGRTNRFTANEVFDMRTLNSNGVTQEAIANKFNVSRQYISSLISGKWGKNLK
jgi:plasmid maintenance system antidote protein VapI